MSDAAVEVFTAFGDVTGEGAIPRPAFIFRVEDAPQVTARPSSEEGAGLELPLLTIVSSPVTWESGLTSCFGDLLKSLRKRDELTLNNEAV
jgi:hypothetical protein